MNRLEEGAKERQIETRNAERAKSLCLPMSNQHKLKSPTTVSPSLRPNLSLSLYLALLTVENRLYSSVFRSRLRDESSDDKSDICFEANEMTVQMKRFKVT